MRFASRGAVILVLLPCFVAAMMPAGSLTTFGDASVSGVNVKSGTAVFPGDTISTGASSAVFNLQNGRTLQIGPNSSMRVSGDSTVEIVKGMSRMQSSKSQRFTMVASNWRLQGQPDAKTGLLAADVVRDTDGKVAVNVSNGKVTAQSLHGNIVMVAEAGKPVMLPSDPTAGSPAGSPGSPSPSPQPGSGGSNKGWIVAGIALGVAGIAVGAAALAADPEDQSRNVIALQGQVNAMTSQISALQTQAANLLTNLNAVSAAAASQQALLVQLNAQIATIVNAQAQLAAAQSTINNLVAKLAANGSLSAADQASLAQAQATVAAQSAILASANAAAQSLINQIKNINIPSNFKP